jgi:hypothetical protein
MKVRILASRWGNNLSKSGTLKWGFLFKCGKMNLRCFKSVHHRTIQTNHQPDATIFQSIILKFIYSSTCFGRFLPIIRSSMTAVAKPEAATAVIELLMMGEKTPETCWAVNKHQDNKLKNCFFGLIYLNWM